MLLLAAHLRKLLLEGGQRCPQPAPLGQGLHGLRFVARAARLPFLGSIEAYLALKISALDVQAFFGSQEVVNGTQQRLPPLDLLLVALISGDAARRQGWRVARLRFRRVAWRLHPGNGAGAPAPGMGQGAALVAGMAARFRRCTRYIPTPPARTSRISVKPMALSVPLPVVAAALEGWPLEAPAEGVLTGLFWMVGRPRLMRH